MILAFTFSLLSFGEYQEFRTAALARHTDADNTLVWQEVLR